MRKVDDGPRTRRALPRNLDITLLELFETVRRTRNLTTAGAELGMSQPAVSRGLARLRAMYADALFVRGPRGVAPTPFAESLAGPVSSALDILRSTLERPTFDAATEVRTFRLALSDVGERILLPRLMDHLARHAPGANVQVVSPTLEQLHEGLAAGQIDLAVGFFGALGKQVRHRRLFRERFIYVARQGHPVADGTLRREQLRELPHVIGGPTGMQHATAVERVLSAPRVRARVALRVHSLLCVGPVVAESDAVGLVPSNLAAVVAMHVPLQLIAPPIQVPGFDVSMVWHERFHRDPANEWLRTVFVGLFEGLKVAAPASETA